MSKYKHVLTIDELPKHTFGLVLPIEYYDEESVANMLYEMDKQQLRYLLSVIEGLLTSHQLFINK